MGLRNVPGAPKKCLGAKKKCLGASGGRVKKSVWAPGKSGVGSGMCLGAMGKAGAKVGACDLEKSVWAPERGEKSDAKVGSGMRDLEKSGAQVPAGRRPSGGLV